MWHVSSRSGVATLRTAIHLLLTYLLTYDKTYDTQSFVGQAAPSCDIFNVGSSYFHVPLTTVRHLLNVTDNSSSAAAERRDRHRALTPTVLLQLTRYRLIEPVALDYYRRRT